MCYIQKFRKINTVKNTTNSKSK